MSQVSGQQGFAAREVHFARPPLVETATSVQFYPLQKFGNAMLAKFWHDHFKDEYPDTQDAEPIESQDERFGEGPTPRAQMMLRFGRSSAARLRMLSDDRHWMIQIQNNRLVFNWRKLGTHDYPRWNCTLPRFRDAYAKLERFADEHKLGSIVPDQWEVTYANHLVRGTDWQSIEEWPALLPGLFGRPAIAEGLRLDSAAGALHLEIKPRRGRLHIEVEHATRRSDNRSEEVLLMQLTARGAVDGGNREGLFDGLSLGRLVIVDAFARLTGDAAHKLWGKQNAS